MASNPQAAIANPQSKLPIRLCDSQTACLMADSTFLHVTNLRCSGIHSPLGLPGRPHLAWQLEGQGRALHQTSYRIMAAILPHFAPSSLRWDSGRVTSSEQMQVWYGGPPPASRQRIWWRVMAWQGEEASQWSEAAWFEMGLLQDDDWQARWIGAGSQPLPEGLTAGPAPLLRQQFTLPSPPVRARAYFCGLGWGELYLNGHKVGEDVLDPLFTRYDRRVLYRVFDVTGQLQPGENVAGIMLGNGWYNQHARDVWNFATADWRSTPKALLQLEIELADGTHQTVVSDAGWRWSNGPIRFDGVRNGEYYDARLEQPGWVSPGFDAGTWSPVQLVPPPGGLMVPQTATAIAVTATLPAVAVTQPEQGVQVVDIGQNLSGWLRWRLSGAAGTEMTVRYGEKLLENGRLDQSNLSYFLYEGDFSTDRYILKDGPQEWEPRFTYHGFHWAEVTGLPEPLQPGAVEGRAVHSALRSAGSFSCSHDLLNRIQQCTRWAFLSNFMGYPTDCPHREKNGWTGDAAIAAETGLLNFETHAAYRKWLDDIEDCRRPSGEIPSIVPTSSWGYNCGGPPWDAALLQIPWYLYLYRGDREVLARHYEAMKHYLHFLGQMADDGIVSFGLGDWCPPVGGPGGHQCPTALTSTGYYALDADLLSRIARVLRRFEEADRFAALAARIRERFHAVYFDAAQGCYAAGDQTSQAFALFHHLVPETERPRVLARLVAAVREKDGHLDCGILGTKAILHVLTDGGHHDLAWQMATKEDFPSWGWWLQQGATTLWETWDGTSSRNHIMFGDISHWCFRVLGGLAPQAAHPGFSRFTLCPHLPEGLEWVQVDHEAPAGTIRSHWQHERDEWRWQVTIPPNTRATLLFPTGGESDQGGAPDFSGITEAGQPLTQVAGVELRNPVGGRVCVEAGSGDYQFFVRLMHNAG